MNPPPTHPSPLLQLRCFQGFPCREEGELPGEEQDQSNFNLFGTFPADLFPALLSEAVRTLDVLDKEEEFLFCSTELASGLSTQPS